MSEVQGLRLRIVHSLNASEVVVLPAVFDYPA
jgi:hypothetical protein